GARRHLPSGRSPGEGSLIVADETLVVIVAGNGLPIDPGIVGMCAPTLVVEPFIKAYRGALCRTQVEVEDDKAQLFARQPLDLDHHAARQTMPAHPRCDKGAGDRAGEAL